MREADFALIALLRQSDQSAFDTLVRQHQKDLYRLAYRMTRNAEDAKDISQEAFLRTVLRLADIAIQRKELAFHLVDIQPLGIESTFLAPAAEVCVKNCISTGVIP